MPAVIGALSARETRMRVVPRKVSLSSQDVDGGLFVLPSPSRQAVEVCAIQTLTEQDRALIAAARAAIARNYDGIHFNFTVGAAVRCAGGRVCTGVNVYSLHGACAEQVALGAAITQGERTFQTIVAVRGPEGEEIIPPCGNCRQILCDYAPDCQVILAPDGAPGKVPARELLPWAYRAQDEA